MFDNQESAISFHTPGFLRLSHGNTFFFFFFGPNSAQLSHARQPFKCSRLPSGCPTWAYPSLNWLCLDVSNWPRCWWYSWTVCISLLASLGTRRCDLVQGRTMNLSQAIKEKQRWFMLLFTPYGRDLNPAAMRTGVSTVNMWVWESACTPVWEKEQKVLRQEKYHIWIILYVWALKENRTEMNSRCLYVTRDPISTRYAN